jgi:hypothetical protein
MTPFIEAVRRLALPIAITSLLVNLVMLVASCIIWVMAGMFGWLDSVEFVSHVSMLALVFSAISGVAAGLAGMLALVPADEIVDELTAED